MELIYTQLKQKLLSSWTVQRADPAVHLLLLKFGMDRQIVCLLLDIVTQQSIGDMNAGVLVKVHELRFLVLGHDNHLGNSLQKNNRPLSASFSSFLSFLSS